MKEKRGIYSFIMELMLIISGILISLFVQSKIEDNQKKEECTQIISQIYNDLKLDTALFNSNIRKADYLMKEFTFLLKADKQILTKENMPAMLEGILATDSKILTILNRGGYMRFTSYGNYELYKRSDLINSIIHYYNNQNEQLTNFYHWDASFVENKVVGFYLTHHTGNLHRYFEQAVLGKSLMKGDADLIKSMIQDDQFQGLQVYNYIIKQNYRNQLQQARDEADMLLQDLHQYLDGVSNK